MHVGRYFFTLISTSLEKLDLGPNYQESICGLNIESNDDIEYQNGSFYIGAEYGGNYIFKGVASWLRTVEQHCKWVKLI